MLKLSHALAWLSGHRWLTFSVFAGAFAGCVAWNLPPHSIVIDTGAAGGSYYQVAEQYKTELEKLGFSVKLHARNESMMLINDVNDTSSGVDVGFIAQSVNARDYPNVTTLGSIGYQPLFIFYRADRGTITRLNELRGRRVAMLPHESATSVAALALLQEFDVTGQNTDFRYAPLAEAARLLRDGEVDAAFFMLESANPIIAQLGRDDAIRMLNLPQTSAIAQHFPFLHAAIIPAATYDLLDNRPDADMHVVAATYDIVVRKNMHPGLVYSLLTVMTKLHNKAGIIAKQGEFPALKDPQLPVNNYAQDYYKNGLPWVHRNFNVVIATLFDTFLVLLLPIFVVMPVYQWLGLPTAGEAYGFLRTRVWLQALRKIDSQLTRGTPLSLQHLAMLKIIEEDLGTSVDRTRQCLEALAHVRAKLRTHSAPPDTALPQIAAQPAG